MDIKELNKSQLIMLALLLIFVTSIATGIVTVTLMQQAPSSVTVPINRVVRQTVEKIVPGEIKNTVQTVIIKEEDLVVDAILKNQTTLFSVSREILNDEGKIVEVNAGKATVVSSDGVVAIDSSLVSGDSSVVYLENNSGKFKADFVSTNKSGFSLFKIGKSLDEKNKVAFTVPNFGDLIKMKIGQKIIVLGNSVSSFMYDGLADLKLSNIKANAGAPVLNLEGELLGISLSGSNSFVSVGIITEALKTTPSL
jgi:S1-C subfamily serine protease